MAYGEIKADSIRKSDGSLVSLSSIPAGDATTSTSGNMSAADKTKLDGIEAGAEVNVVTSIAGRDGAVTLTTADVSGFSTALDAKADLVDGVVPTSQIPALAITEFLGEVANETAMLALTGQKGDWCLRQDNAVGYVITGSDPSQASSWSAVTLPGSAVTSINSQVGTVVLAASDVNAVADTGDNMTGDLTLGTDKIVLDATSGAADFAGNVVTGSSPAGGLGTGVQLRASTGTVRAGGNSTSANFEGYQAGTSNPTFKVLGDGSAHFMSSVGIGTLTPAGRLQVQATSAVNAYITSTTANANLRVVSGDDNQAALIFGDASDALTGGIRFDHSDNSLQFLGHNYEEGFRLDSDGRLLVGLTSTSLNANAVFEGASGGDTGAARIFFQRGSEPANGQSLANFFFTDNSGNQGAQIDAIRDGGAWTPGSSHPTKLQFRTTANDESSPTPRMTIDSSGRLLVGTTSASTQSGISAAKLQVLGGLLVGTDNAGTNGSGYIAFASACNSPSDSRPVIYHHQGVGLSLKSDANISFEVGADEKGRFDNDGRLLVGATSASSHSDARHAFIQTFGNNSGNFQGGRITIGRAEYSSNITDGEILGDLYFTDAQSGCYAKIEAVADGTANANDYPGRLVFSTTSDGSSTPTERMRIASNGRVGINTTSPANTLHVKGLYAPARFETTAPQGGCYLEYADADARKGYLGYGSTANEDFFVSNEETGGAIVFRTETSEKLRILSGGGLTFNGDLAQANALEDYEEGSWTPTLNYGGSVTVNKAVYTKIGRVVNAYLYISTSNIPNNTARLEISGLPFNSLNTTNYYSVGNVGFAGTKNIDVARPLVMTNNNYIYFHRVDGDANDLQNSFFTGLTYLILSVTYQAA